MWQTMAQSPIINRPMPQLSFGCFPIIIINRPLPPQPQVDMRARGSTYPFLHRYRWYIVAVYNRLGPAGYAYGPADRWSMAPVYRKAAPSMAGMGMVWVWPQSAGPYRSHAPQPYDAGRPAPCARPGLVNHTMTRRSLNHTMARHCGEG